METAITPTRAARVETTRGLLSSPPSAEGAAILLALAGLCAGAAVVAALGTDVLAHPTWFALQRADLIVAPVAVGAYWWMRRPRSRFGLLLVVSGFCAAPLAFEAASSPTLRTLGSAWEVVPVALTIALVLAFPTGRLEGVAAWASLAILTVTNAVLLVFGLLFAPVAAGPTVAACSGTCPANPFAVRADAGLVEEVTDVTNWIVLATLAFTAVVLVRRLVAASRPRVPMLAVGTAGSLAVLVAYAVIVFAPDPWTLGAARAALPWAFLAALLVADVVAGRLLRRLVDVSLAGGTLPHVRLALADAFRDDGLRITLDGTGGSNGHVVTPAGQAAAIVHRADIAHDPELLDAARRGVLLALRTDAAVTEVQSSRARIAAAGDAERRRLERDLHDGAQQQLVALQIKLGLARDGIDAELYGDVESELDDALRTLRDLAHGIHPITLTDGGLEAALSAAAARSEMAVRLHVHVGRYPIELESAVYYCCLEALQNSTKHGGPNALPSIAAEEVGGRLVFAVADRGCGFDVHTVSRGDGLRNMQDRIAAVGGLLEIASAPGRGTTVSGSVPV